MATYTLEYQDGTALEIEAADDAAAAAAACAVFENAGVGAGRPASEWQPAGRTEDGRECERLLIWYGDWDSTVQLLVVR